MTPELPEPTVVVRLPDGRAIAADDVGDPDGTPVLYLHGAPDCRLARHPDDALAARLGVRLLAVDRPGYGGTDPQPVLDEVGWAGDVAALLDHLGVGSCAVAAWSAGVPWAVGLALGLPDRVTRLVTYGAVAPIEGLGDPVVAAASGRRGQFAEAAQAATTVAEVVDEIAGLLVPAPPFDLALAREVVVANFTARALAEVDRVPGMVAQLAASLSAAVQHHGAEGLRGDLTIQLSPGQERRLAEVRCPVVLVHGEHDNVAGPPVGHWLARRLGDGRVEVWPGLGHQGLLPAWQRWLTLAA